MTGGADSMVHAFALLDLVEEKVANKAKAIQPIRTWSKHYLPVTALTPLTSGRMASASEDGQVVVMEVFSEATLATIQMPQAIRVLTSQDHRLFAGDKHGSIYLIDLDEYAVQKTAQLGAVVKRKNTAGSGSTKTSVKRVFAGEGAATCDGGTMMEAAYTVELTGHDRAITALAFLDDKDQEWLISGDEAGILRIWDLESLGCVRAIQPWSHSAQSSVAAVAGAANTDKTSSALHPVTSICIVPQGEDLANGSGGGMYSTSSGARDKNGASTVASLVTPLQKFTQPSDQVDRLPVPFLQSKRDSSSLSFWDVSTSDFSFEAALAKRRRLAGTGRGKRGSTAAVAQPQDLAQTKSREQLFEQQQEEIERLQHELEETKTTVERWETVNNKLMAKLQQK